MAFFCFNACFYVHIFIWKMDGKIRTQWKRTKIHSVCQFAKIVTSNLWPRLTF